MKRINVLLMLLLVIGTACQNMNQDGANNDNQDVNPDQTLNTPQEVTPDTMTNDEDFTEDYNAVNDENYMTDKMNELSIREFSIEFSYGKDKEYSADIDQDTDEPIEAEVEDEINNELLHGREAFDHIFERIEKLEITSNSSEQEVLDALLNAFKLPAEYEKADIEITFTDGKQINFEDRQM